MNAVELRDITVHFGRTVAASRVSFEVAPGETLALLGPSGSGKSTALKAIAGFVRPSSGRVLLAGRDVTDAPPDQRGLGVVVQSYALFPHMRVAENVAFGLAARKTSRAETSRRVAEVLGMVGMSEYARRFPRELSGGQQQRVAIARALAIRPPVLLLDEPLSALDAALREEMVAELLRLRAELPDTAIVHVTHDQSEALALADRIGVMRDGQLVDIGPARELYQCPPSRFTASFLGAANLLPVQVLGAGEVDFAGTILRANASSATRGDRMALAVRPHEVTLSANGEGMPAVLTGIQWRGNGFRLDLDLYGTPLRAELSTVDTLPPVGSEVSITIPHDCPLVSA